MEDFLHLSKAKTPAERGFRDQTLQTGLRCYSERLAEHPVVENAPYPPHHYDFRHGVCAECKAVAAAKCLTIAPSMRLGRRTAITLSQPVGTWSAKALKNAGAFAHKSTITFDTRQIGIVIVN